MTRRLVLGALFGSLLVLAPAPAGAQILDLTPNLVAQVKRLAESALAKHPTSPTDAANAFQAAFNGEFGDMHPAEAYLLTSPDIEITIQTPLIRYIGNVITRLAKLEPIPDPLPQPAEFLGGAAYLTISVTPKTMKAPNVTRLVVFRDERPVTIADALEAKTFTNRFGASVTIGTGFVGVPVSVFQPSGTVKIVALATPKNLEWTIPSDGLKKFR